MPRQTYVELLAPAGNFEKLETAVHFGADAVYLSGKDFSLRNFSGNFGLDELEAAVAFGQRHKVKIYIACNIYSRNHEQKALREYLSRLSLIAPDAIIVADPAVFQAARERMPHIPIHISTQANTTNYVAATVKAYREAIDAYYRTPDPYRVKEDWRNLLDSVNQRGYSTGFYFGAPDELDPNPALTRAGYAHRLVGKILSASCDGRATLDVRNRMAEGDPVEILSPGRPIARDVIARMTEADGRPLTVAHAGMQVQTDLRRPCGPKDLLLRRGDSPADRPAQDPAQPQAPAERQHS